jgi:hypothetical protein
MGSNITERTKFYHEIASCGMEYTPPKAYFADVLYAIEDMQKQINDLRQDNERMHKELNKIFK